MGAADGDQGVEQGGQAFAPAAFAFEAGRDGVRVLGGGAKQIGQVLDLLGRGMGLVHFQQGAQVDDKALCGGQFAGGDALPAGDEVFCGQALSPDIL